MVGCRIPHLRSSAAARPPRARGALGPATFLLERAADDLVGAAVGGAASVRSRASISARRAMCCGARLPIACGTIVAAIIAARSQFARGSALAVVADEEALPFRDGSLDLVVSALALQFVNDLPGTLIQIRRALKPDGLLLAAHDRRRQPCRIARGLRRGRGRGRGRRVAARRAVCRSARSRRAAAARGLRAAGDRRRPGHRALCLAARADARPSPHGRRQRAGRAPPRAAPPRDACAGCWKSMPSASPIRTAASARPSRSSGCRAGRRTKASSSRSSRARPERGSPMHCGRGRFRPVRRPVARPGPALLLRHGRRLTWRAQVWRAAGSSRRRRR